MGISMQRSMAKTYSSEKGWKYSRNRNRPSILMHVWLFYKGYMFSKAFCIEIIIKRFSLVSIFT